MCVNRRIPAFFSNALLLLAALSAEPAMLLREWGEPIPLSRCVVVTNDAALGTRVAGALEAKGAEATVVTGGEACANSGSAAPATSPLHGGLVNRFGQ